ncbi:unnamed protein product [Owenia fusiformis]|uniref:Uncharacterized protein n=1 Tax=Owenia fusiformis TaxID=6347 RepID=A0A8J1UD33_OWEFU|nr:unnamed protein product [Owenia fusiformis]
MFSGIKNSLKGLGKGKKSTGGGSDGGKNDLVSVHKRKRRFKQTNASELAKWTHIKDTLGEKYESSKSKDFMTRYELMKGMIKDAIEECEKAEKFKGLPNKAESGVQSGSGGGKIGRLTAACKEFAESENEIMNEEEFYLGKSSKDLEREIQLMDIEIPQIKRNIDILKGKFTDLSREYEGSKNLNPKQRYDKLKDLIKGMYREPKKF